MDNQLKDYLKTAQEIANKVGEIVKEAYYKEKNLKTKGSYTDVVTETDQAVENMIINMIREKYPTHQFIGEESTVEGEKVQWTDAPTWIIDPIDGTLNFVHNIPHVCVCIGLSVKKEMVIGVVHLPITGQTFHASKGGGAYCNSEQLFVSKQTDIKKSVIHLEGGYSRDQEVVATKMDIFRKILEASHGVRIFGSAAINICMVASGSGEGYVDYGPHIWDFAAAGLILQEAGGVLLDPSGANADLLSRRLLATCNKDIANQVVPLLTNIHYERD